MFKMRLKIRKRGSGRGDERSSGKAERLTVTLSESVGTNWTLKPAKVLESRELCKMETKKWEVVAN